MLEHISLLLYLLGYKNVMMTGEITSAQKRQALIDQFNRNKSGDLFCMLLTTKVGGVGLNITGADRG
jgi:DNA excision repair protein ERCC-6